MRNEGSSVLVRCLAANEQLMQLFTSIVAFCFFLLSYLSSFLPACLPVKVHFILIYTCDYFVYIHNLQF